MMRKILQTKWSRTVLAPTKLLLHGVLVAASFAEHSEQVQVHLRNDAALRLQIGWFDNESETIQPIGILEPFGAASLNAFEDHEFELQELPPNENGGRCKHLSELDHGDGEALQKKEGCAINKFRVGDLEDQCTCYWCCE